jgi:hypothetical protein
MSATQRWLGAVAVKSRSSRSPGRAAASAGMVVRRGLPRTAPHRFALRINRSTVQRATGMPSRCSCRHTLRAPYTP